MLRVWSVSGDELAALTAGEVEDVQALKNRIREQRGIPVSIQAFLHNQHRLDVFQELEVPMELQLIQESFHDKLPGTLARNMTNMELIEYAATTGNEEVARRLLDAGADKDCRQDGETVLIRSAAAGHVGMVNLLLGRSASVDLSRRDGKTALTCSCQNQYVEVSRLLLQARANPHLCDLDGKAPLPHAALQGHVQILDLLLEHRASVNQPSQPSGRTPLLDACRIGHERAAWLLLQARANPRLHNLDGKAPLLHAALQGHVQLLDLLLEHRASVNQPSQPSGRTPFLDACRRGHERAAWLLLRARACPDSQDFSGYSALDYAAWQGCVAIVKLLLEVGPKDGLRSASGLRALHHALVPGNQLHAAEVVHLLLAAGAGRELPDGLDAMPALHLASMNGQTSMVHLMLQAGLDKNLQDHEGMTAMMEASCEGQVDVVRLLLGENADCDLRDKEGMTALSHAKRQGHTEIVRLLEAGQ